MKVIAIAIVAALLSACASRAQIPASPPPADHGHDPKAPPAITLIKIQNPATIRMENDPHLLVAGLAMLGVSKIRNAAMSERLTSELYRLNQNYGGLLSDELKRNLTASGIAISDAPPLPVNPEKPWNYKFKQISASGPNSLYVYIESIGIRSHHNTSYYQPKAHFVYCMTTQTIQDDCAHGGRIAFGDNYAEADDSTILATPAERWFDDQSAYTRVSEIDQALKRGITISAERIAQQLVKSMSTTP